MRLPRFLLPASLALFVLTAPALAQTPSFVLEWGTPGTGPGQIDTPSQIATDAAGNIYLADRGNHRIQKFSSTGAFITQWGSLGTGNGQFNSPSGIAVGPFGDVYVADFLNNRIQRFDTDGVYQSQWGSPGSGDGQFNHPYSIAVEPAGGDVYVVDYHNHRVQRFAWNGVFLNQWGGAGVADGQFRFPSGITTDSNGNVYVADILNARIQKFNGVGTFLTKWGSYGSGPGQFGGSNILVGPYGLTTDRDDNIYVADGGNSRVEKFTSSGVYLSQWGTVGSGPGEFGADSPADIGRSKDGRGIYVSERVGNRIQLFRDPLTIAYINDVRNDQGRNVWITFTRSSLDAVGSPTPILQYEVYRRVDPLPAPALAANRVAEPSQSALAGWAYVSSVPAHGDETYTLVAPTLVDSMTDGIHRSTFLIRATTASPYVTFSSPADSGYSVDNLAPAPPVLLTAAYQSGATHLDWAANTEPDLWYYNVYRGSSAGFVPGPGNRIAAVGPSDVVDVGAAGSYYKLSAVDVNGNESGFTLVTPAQTTGVGGDAEVAFALEGVRPNPSRRQATTISFALASGARASLEVFDISGRQVFTREVGGLGAGRHVLDLAASRLWAPGLYLVRLTQQSQHATTRMIVIE